MNFQQAVDYLYSRLPVYQRVGKAAYKPDLSNTIKLCEALGNPHHKFKSIHIAGTNGKGSTAHMISAIMQTAGFKTGLYTSPHLKSFTERIKINGDQIDENEVKDFVNKNFGLIEDIKPSFFEITVAMAFHYFANKKVDIAVVEVGMGGRLDSTNIITPEVSIITNISHDHQNILGNTLKELATEKAGIIKDKVPVVIGINQSSVSGIFKKTAKEKKSDIYFAADHFKIQKEHKYHHILRKSKLYLKNLNFTELPEYSLKNMPAVVECMLLMRERGFSISEKDIKTGLENYKSITGMRGRWQILNKDPLMICDIAHNVAAVKTVLSQIQKLNFNDLHIVWGMVKDKSINKMLKLLPKDAFYYFCEPKIFRARNPDLIYKEAFKLGLKARIIHDVNEAIKNAVECSSREDLIFIGGSTFVVAEIDNL